MRKSSQYLDGYAFANLELANQILESVEDLNETQINDLRGLVASATAAMSEADAIQQDHDDKRDRLFDTVTDALVPQLMEYIASLMPKAEPAQPTDPPGPQAS